MKEQGDHKATIPERTAQNKHLPMYKTKWTDQDQGQKVFCGWAPEALKKFKSLKEAIKAKHKSKAARVELVEKTLLQNLRIENKIQMNSPAEEAKNKRRSKRKFSEIEQVTYTLDDDEECSDMEEEDSDDDATIQGDGGADE